jgi:outer membrane scaffolding protein for murein synthesis (MipA/OmpV family)
MWFGGLLAARPATAQTPSPLAEWQYSSGVQLERLFEPAVPTWEVEIGLGTQFGPDSDGIRRYQIQPGPVFNIRYKDELFASTGEGIGLNLLSFSHFRMGAAISYDLGRAMHEDGRALNGLGNVYPAPEAKVFASYVPAKSVPVTIRFDVRKQIGATDGWIGDFGIYLPMPGSSERFAWFAGPGVTVADGRYMQGYFGVSDAQAASTHYRRYKASAGFKSATFGVSAVWMVTPHWLVDGNAAVEELLGSAAESPITETKLQGVVTLAGIYKF